jgi:hypothetical protein
MLVGTLSVIFFLSFRKIRKNLKESKREFDKGLYNLKKEYVSNQLFYIAIIIVIWVLPIISLLTSSIILEEIAFFIVLS